MAENNNQTISKSIKEYLASDAEAPDKVKEYVGFAIDAVRNALEVDMELQEVDISFLDHYLNTLGQVSPSISNLVISACGVYFGELLRKKMGAVWHLENKQEPATWELRFKSCPLAITPVLIAAEVLAKEEKGANALVVNPTRRDVLGEVLDNAVPMSQETYFSFAGRYDAIALAEDVLKGIEEKLRDQLEEDELRDFDLKFGEKDPLQLKCIPLDYIETTE